MNRVSSSELQLHYSVLEKGSGVFPRIFEIYNPQLLSCVFRWYKHFLHDDPTLAQEAVYRAVKHYSEHPRTFNPVHGSLQRFLEIATDRCMQSIFEREKYPVKASSVKHVLAKYFDNDRDILLAKMLLKNEMNTFSFISLLDIGSYPFRHQQTEIARETMRVRRMLEQFNLLHLTLPEKKNIPLPAAAVTSSST